MNNLMIEMNYILQQWQSKYDIFHLTHFHFTLGEGDILCLNDIPVPEFHSLPLEFATFDAEHVLYYFYDSYVLHITIAWPEEETPTVSSVSYDK